MSKDFSQFAKMIDAREITEDNLALIRKINSDDKLDLAKIAGFFTATQVQTCLKILEQYHQWLEE